MDTITIEYHGTTITYDEEANLWRFTLRGRDRSTVSLMKAKEAIGAPPPAKEAVFQKFNAWFFRYGCDPEKVEITGIAESNYRGPRVYIKDAAGKRSKEPAKSYLYECSDENDAKLEQILFKEKESRKLKEEILCLRNSLTPIKITPEP